MTSVATLFASVERLGARRRWAREEEEDMSDEGEKTVCDPRAVTLVSDADQAACAEYLRHNAGDEAILKYFAFEHLPPTLRPVSAWFACVAVLVHATLPRCAERTAALRKTLEAKDCAVRAAL